ncbi:ABC transporter substrate-binding protein [Microbacterium sp. LWH7-1.2]|uniref:ABC transporter substrate-binding protein n=1 Tax=Microbacterium sp. LWH7-1.2 TaxID=3135257 RepID=UPI003139D43B
MRIRSRALAASASLSRNGPRGLRWKVSAATVAIAALALTGCAGAGEDGSASSGSGRADQLTIATSAAPASYDISEGGDYGNRSPFFQAVFDTLLQKDSSGEIEPWLATEWSYNDDNTVLTLTLRDDVEFTDGTKLDADAVAASLAYVRDGSGPLASGLAGKEFTALDATTVAISQPAPDPSLIDQLSFAPGLIQAPSTFDDPDAATEPVGSGPYVLDTTSTVTGSTYIYTANPDYWNPDAIKYDNLTIRVLEDPTATLNAIKAGEINGARLKDNVTIPQVEASGWTVESNQLDFQGLLLFDRAGTMAPELGDVRVRRAINMAFDREALLEALQDGHGTVTEQVFRPASVGFDESLDTTYAYDPKGAKALLAEAGYPDGFTLDMGSTPLFQTTNALVAQQLADIGVTVKYDEAPTAQWYSDMTAGKHPAEWMSLGQEQDWMQIRALIAPDAPWNPLHSQDPQVDEYIKTIQMGTKDEADQATKDLNAYLVEQAWFAPFFRVDLPYAVDAKTNLEFWPTNAYPSIFGFSPKD